MTNLHEILEQSTDFDKSSIPTIVAVLLLTLSLAIFTHKLFSVQAASQSRFSQVFWNALADFMPSNLVLGSKSCLQASPVATLARRSFSGPQQYAAKSDVLRSVFGLEKLQGFVRGGSGANVPPGLGNWDNSCYQNSVLQALASCRSLRIFFDKVEELSIDTAPDSTIKALSLLTKDLNGSEYQGKRLWTPAKLKSMSSWQQQDAQEYYSKIIDEMEKDIKPSARTIGRVRGISLSQVNEDEYEVANRAQNGSGRSQIGSILEPKSKPTQNVADELSSKTNESLRNPLEGLLAQRVGCTRCGHSDGVSLIPFNCVTLPLGPQWTYSVEQCLDEYTKLEPIEGVECAKCTLLQMRHRLREAIEQLATSPRNGEVEENEDETAEEKFELRRALNERMEVVSEAIRDEDFSESTLVKKCHIPSKMRVSSTKSRQAIIMRAPQCLVLHVNRSVFDEARGAQLKNYADVQYPGVLDITKWTVGSKIKLNLDEKHSPLEEWEMDPRKSMMNEQEAFERTQRTQYELRAVIQHVGRHENGHYICFRKTPRISKESTEPEDDEPARVEESDDDEQWWRLSDEDVYEASEETALSQGGAFMLFYERIEQHADTHSNVPVQDLQLSAVTVLSEEKESEAAIEDDASSTASESTLAPSTVPKLDTEGFSDTSTVDEDIPNPEQAIEVPLPVPDAHINVHPEAAVGAAQDPLPALQLNPHEASTHNTQTLSSSNPQQYPSSIVDLQRRHMSPLPMRTAGPSPKTGESSSFAPVHVVATN